MLPCSDLLVVLGTGKGLGRGWGGLGRAVWTGEGRGLSLRTRHGQSDVAKPEIKQPFTRGSNKGGGERAGSELFISAVATALARPDTARRSWRTRL